MPLDAIGGTRAPSRGIGRSFHPTPQRRGCFRRPHRGIPPEPRAEALLRAIAEGADFLMRTETETQPFVSSDFRQVRTYVHLLVSIPPEAFDQLCRYGAHLEDDEEDADFEKGEDDEPSLAPAGDGHFRFERLRNDAADDDREKGDAPAQKVEAMRQRYQRSPRAEIRTGDGRLIGVKQANGLISLRLGRAGR